MSGQLGSKERRRSSKWVLPNTECGALLPPNVHWRFYPCWIERLCRCRSSPGSCYSSGGSQHSSQTGKPGSSLGRGAGTSAPLGLTLLSLAGRTAKNSCSLFHLCQVTGEMKGPMAQQILPILVAMQIKRLNVNKSRIWLEHTCPSMWAAEQQH